MANVLPMQELINLAKFDVVGKLFTPQEIESDRKGERSEVERGKHHDSIKELVFRRSEITSNTKARSTEVKKKKTSVEERFMVETQ